MGYVSCRLDDDIEDKMRAKTKKLGDFGRNMNEACRMWLAVQEGDAVLTVKP
jgi:hypothetical protein